MWFTKPVSMIRSQAALRLMTHLMLYKWFVNSLNQESTSDWLIVPYTVKCWINSWFMNELIFWIKFKQSFLIHQFIRFTKPECLNEFFAVLRYSLKNWLKWFSNLLTHWIKNLFRIDLQYSIKCLINVWFMKNWYFEYFFIVILNLFHLVHKTCLNILLTSSQSLEFFKWLLNSQTHWIKNLF